MAFCGEMSTDSQQRSRGWVRTAMGQDRKNLMRLVERVFAYREMERACAARDIGAITAADSDAVIRQVIEVRRMLYGLIKRLDEPR
jgi:hypothetical protein